MWRSGLLIGLLVFGTDQLLADDAAAWQALREGRAVLIMRHASAPGWATLRASFSKTAKLNEI